MQCWFLQEKTSDRSIKITVIPFTASKSYSLTAHWILWHTIYRPPDKDSLVFAEPLKHLQSLYITRNESISVKKSRSKELGMLAIVLTSCIKSRLSQYPYRALYKIPK